MLWQRIANALISYVRYLRTTFWFPDLAIFYPMQPWPLYLALAAALLLVLITYICYTARTSRPCLIVGWFWFLGTIFPVIGILQSGEQALADRFTYFPSIGLSLAFVWLIPDRLIVTRLSKVILAAGAFLAALVLVYFTVIQIGYWTNSLSVYTHALAVVGPDVVPVQTSLGMAYNELGQNALAKKHLQIALRLEPNSAPANLQMGTVEEGLGHYDEAMRLYILAATHDASDPKPHDRIGNLFFRQGNFSMAITAFTEAVRLEPDNSAYVDELAQAQTTLKQIDSHPH